MLGEADDRRPALDRPGEFLCPEGAPTLSGVRGAARASERVCGMLVLRVLLVRMTGGVPAEAASRAIPLHRMGGIVVPVEIVPGVDK